MDLATWLQVDTTLASYLTEKQVDLTTGDSLFDRTFQVASKTSVQITYINDR